MLGQDNPTIQHWATNASELYAKTCKTHLLYHLSDKDGLKWELEEEITQGTSFVHNGNIKSNGIFIIYSGKHPDDLIWSFDDICGHWADLTRTIGFAYAVMSGANAIHGVVSSVPLAFVMGQAEGTLSLIFWIHCCCMGINVVELVFVVRQNVGNL